MGLTGPSIWDLSLQVCMGPELLGNDTLSRRAQNALDPRHNLAQVPNTPCRSLSLPPLCTAAQHPLIEGPFPKQSVGSQGEL